MGDTSKGVANTLKPAKKNTKKRIILKNITWPKIVPISVNNYRYGTVRNEKIRKLKRQVPGRSCQVILNIKKRISIFTVAVPRC